MVVWLDISYLQTSQVNDCLPRVNRDCDSITGEDFRHRFLPKHVLECRTWKLLKRENSYLEKFNETLLEMQLVSFGGRWKVFRTVQAFRLNFKSNSGIRYYQSNITCKTAERTASANISLQGEAIHSRVTCGRYPDKILM